MSDFGHIFRAFQSEALFTKEMLGLGVTQIRKANYASKGIYYEAFTCLSTGFERIGKLCLILDFYIDHRGSLPNVDYMKREIGHNLVKLYEQSLNVAKKHDIAFRFKNHLDEEIYQRILHILSQFSMGDRYSNINILSNRQQKSDSMSDWYTKIDMYIFEHCVTDKVKMKIMNNAQWMQYLMGSHALVRYTAETGRTITNLELASFQTGMQDAVAPYRQLFVLQMIRYWVELIEKLGDKARGINRTEFEIPYFSEIFGGFYNKDSYLKSRKTWDSI